MVVCFFIQENYSFPVIQFDNIMCTCHYIYSTKSRSNVYTSCLKKMVGTWQLQGESVAWSLSRTGDFTLTSTFCYEVSQHPGDSPRLHCATRCPKQNDGFCCYEIVLKDLHWGLVYPTRALSKVLLPWAQAIGNLEDGTHKHPEEARSSQCTAAHD